MATSKTTGSTENKSSQLFLQSVKVGTTEIPRSMIARCVYIETADLSAPQLELEVRDGTSYLSDTLGVTKGTILTCSMGNPRGTGNASWVDTFEVLKAPEQGDMVRIIAFGQHVKALKERAVSPQFFVKKQPAIVLKALAGGLTVDADSFKQTGHLPS
ncbi:hypothetical protein [Pantoea sp. CCBC3-3-1]|uniref:hypothetical protein n=1 Tax=Pantoea sp. CCBC3-3-1 TaxID=2490851 RepID=UPI0011BE1338|nr:hypothetical protein [Pantoea sp. CCBC3-3-1]